MSTIGEQLKIARETQKLTIKQVVQVIRVRGYYLQAMENDDFAALPSAAQARGFLRLYADYLGLDSDGLTNQLRGESIPVPPAQQQVEATAFVQPILTEQIQGVGLPQDLVIDEKEEQAPEETQIPEQELDTARISALPAESQSIFSEIGSTLRNRRELISLTLDEVERHMHVRKHNLELIEAGNFDELPSPVQLRGTLSTYASFLDLDTDSVLLRYADAIQSRRIERQETEMPKSNIRQTRIGLPAWLPRFISPDLIFGGSMIIILLTLSIWGAERIFSKESPVQNTPTQGPSISDVLLAPVASNPPSSSEIPTSVIDNGTPIPTMDPNLVPPSETAIATETSAVQVTVIVLDRTFLKVTVDGEIKQNGRVSPGAALTFDGSNQIEVLTGSGNAVQIIFNQGSLGVMGNFGEVVNRIYTVNGVQTPTPTPSPTPTITPIPSRTPRPSATPRPSSTQRPTSTSRPSSTSRP